MFKKACIIVFVFFFSVQIYSQYYYSPDNSTLLLLSKKKDIKASFTIPLDDTAINFQAGYSPFNNFALSLSSYRHSNIQHDGFEGTKGKQLSAALGFYFFYERDKINTSPENNYNRTGFLMDCYLGFTQGSITNNYPSITTSKLNYQKLYFQFGLHLKSKLIGISYIAKFSTLDFQKALITGDPNTSEVLLIEEKISLEEPYTLWETDLRLHVGPEYLSGFVGVSMIHPNILDKVLVKDRNIVLAVGVTLGISDLYQMKKEGAF